VAECHQNLRMSVFIVSSIFSTECSPEETVVKIFTIGTLENSQKKFLELINNELCELEAIDGPVMSIEDFDQQAIINYVNNYKRFTMSPEHFMLKTSEWKIEIEIKKYTIE